MEISTTATTPAHGWRAVLGRLGRGIGWLFRLIGAVALGLLTGVGFYVLATLSGWAAGLGCLLLLAALVRRWPASRRAVWKARLARAVPLLWIGTLTTGVGASVVMAWRGHIGAAWLLLVGVGVGLLVWIRLQAVPAEGLTKEFGGWLAQDGDWLLNKDQVEQLAKARQERLNREEPLGSFSFDAPDKIGNLSTSPFD